MAREARKKTKELDAPSAERAPARVASSAKKTSAKKTSAKKTSAKKTSAKPRLLAGGNPQIPKGDGEAPVRAYIDAMPGWKHLAGQRLDDLVVRAVPGVQKAVKWNSPFYGIEGRGWFLSFHCFSKYVKLTFFRGTSLRPVPPGASKTPETRYKDIYETDTWDEELLVSWFSQAADLPGWVP